MFGKFRKALEWLGLIETVNAILHIEFVRTLLLPTVVAVMTGAAGIFGHVPFMRIIARLPSHLWEQRRAC
jgi:hypothetical protein